MLRVFKHIHFVVLFEINIKIDHFSSTNIMIKTTMQAAAPLECSVCLVRNASLFCNESAEKHGVCLVCFMSWKKNTCAVCRKGKMMTDDEWKQCTGTAKALEKEEENERSWGYPYEVSDNTDSEHTSDEESEFLGDDDDFDYEAYDHYYELLAETDAARVRYS
jgi:hypothetical protein